MNSLTAHHAHLPRHVGIIMDGNGRWAEHRGLPRTQGHLEGLSAAKRVVAYLASVPVPFVTLYTFSTENWRRPKKEVSYLMNLISTYLVKEYPFYREHNIRVAHIGCDSLLPRRVRTHLAKAEKLTEEHSGTTVILALNYGGRDEIIRAVNRVMERAEPGEPCTAELLQSCLDTAAYPDPELIIRSAGEKRLSNFMLWQSAYAEYCFCDTLWPDWDGSIIEECLMEFQQRRRKFGGLYE